MTDFKNKRRYAYYRIFSVGDKNSGYKLTVGEYHGNAGMGILFYLQLTLVVLLLHLRRPQSLFGVV